MIKQTEDKGKQGNQNLRDDGDSQQLLEGLVKREEDRISSSGALNKADKTSKINRAKKRLDLLQAPRAAGFDNFSVDDVTELMVKIAALCE